MRTEKKFMRRRYAPLVTGCSLTCTTPESPLTQLYSGGEYQPNREGTAAVPCGICPIISASARDGSWQGNPRSNAHLSQMQWYVDGQKIESVTSWNGKYSIITSGDNKGMLIIKRNIGLNERVKLRFEGKLLDFRNNELVPVKSDEKTLYTVQAAQDSWSVETDYPLNLMYSCIDDNMLLHDYQVSHGIASSLSDQQINDGEQYLRTAAIRVRKGKEIQKSGYTLELYRTDSGTEVKMSVGYDLQAFSLTSMTLDLRLVPNAATYLLKVLVGGKVVCMKTICTVNRLHKAISVKPSVESDIYPDTDIMYQEAIVKCKDHDVPCAENVVKMVLLGTTAYESDVKLGEGREVFFRLSDLTMGDTQKDNYVETCFDYDYKEEYKVATDASGNVYTDENGNPFIFN